MVAEEARAELAPAALTGGALSGGALSRGASQRKRLWQRFRTNPSAIGSAIVLAIIVVSAMAADLIAPHDPYFQALSNQLRPPVLSAEADPNHFLGTDQFGRDIYSRILFGGRVSLLIGFVASTASAIIGIVLGLVSGYVGGRLDSLIMRFADVWIAFPFLVLAIAVLAVLGRDIWVLLALLSFAGWVYYARITRGQTLQIRGIEYVQAARAMGASNTRIIVRHILPNVLSPNLIIWTFSIASLILIESGLSFLGLGVQPPTPTWGNLLADGRSFVADAWWIAFFPGIAIMITVLAVNTLGDALRDILDPRLQY